MLLVGSARAMLSYADGSKSAYVKQSMLKRSEQSMFYDERLALNAKTALTLQNQKK